MLKNDQWACGSHYHMSANDAACIGTPIVAVPSGPHSTRLLRVSCAELSLLQAWQLCMYHKTIFKDTVQPLVRSTPRLFGIYASTKGILAVLSSTSDAQSWRTWLKQVCIVIIIRNLVLIILVRSVSSVPLLHTELSFEWLLKTSPYPCTRQLALGRPSGYFPSSSLLPP